MGAPERLQALTREMLQRRGYSISRAIRAFDARLGNDPRRVAPLECEISDELARQLGHPAPLNGLYVPVNLEQRALATTPGSAGGFAVPVVTAPNDMFVAAYRAASVGAAMGVEVVSDLAGTVAVPRIATGATFTWQTSQGLSISQADPVFGQLSGTPRTAIAFTQISNSLLNQASPQAQGFIWAELGATVAAGFDAALINGSGGAQPLGIKNTTGVLAESGASISWATVTSMVYDVANVNGIRNPQAAGFVADPNTEKLLAQREKAAGSGIIWDGDQIGRRRAMSSNSVPANTLIFGDWSSVAMLTWGVMELTINPSNGFDVAACGVRAVLMCDILVRNPKSFCVASSIS